MAKHRMEQLATKLASMPDTQREWVLVRAKDLVKLKRAAGQRLSGKSDSRWGRLVSGGMLYDVEGEPLARVRYVNIKSDARDYDGLVVTTIEITAYPVEDDPWQKEQQQT